jgi:hypothetical protein
MYRNFIPLFTAFFVLLSANISDGRQLTESPLDFLEDSVSYLWPTDASRQLSSTFAETRSAHLHSGIDIRTWGREGYRVFASRDGIIYRIGIGPHGYGHVIYMKHGDNSYTVYAHLNRFEPELQAYADSIRMLDYTYEIDLIIEGQEFEFKQGDVIGYSGSTGVGPPHLHFEVRSPDFTPVNPLLTDLSVRDNIPPVFTQLAVETLDPETLHRTNHSVYAADESGEGYDFGEIMIHGPVGLAVNVHDRANQSPNVYAVHSLKLVHRADTLFHSQADSFAFHDAGHMFLDRSYPILAKTRRGFQRLYRVEGNRLPFYLQSINEGVVDLPKGTYPMEIIASDIFGNESRASLTLRVIENESQRESIAYVPAYPDRQHESERIFHPWRNNHIPFTESLLASTDLVSYELPANPYPFLYTSRTSALKQLSPGSIETLHTPDQKLWMQFPSEALYDTLNLKLQVTQQANQIDFNFLPDRLPVDRPVYLNYILPDEFKDRNGLALFSVDHYRNRETFMRADISDGILRVRMDEIADLRLKQDRTAPWVGRPRIEENLGGQYIVILPSVDRDTGIDYRRSQIHVNGRRGIVEYDPDHDLVMYYRPGFQPEEINEIKYSVYDGAGNRTARTVQVSYSPPQPD